MNSKYGFLILFRIIFIILSVSSFFSCIKDFENDVIKKATNSDTVSGTDKTELTQYTNIVINNPYFETLEIYADDVLLARLATNERKQISLSDQKYVTFKMGESKVTKPTKIRKIPQITITPLQEFGIDASLRQLQDSVCFRVDIIDEFPQNLIIKYDGPFEFKELSPTAFNVTLRFLDSEAAFKKFIIGTSAPYKVNFTFTVQDKIAPYKIENEVPVIFGKW